MSRRDGTKKCDDKSILVRLFSELIHTEKTHVGYLKVLSKTLYQPLKDNSILPGNFVQFAPCTLLALIFPNLEEILAIHSMNKLHILNNFSPYKTFFQPK